MRITPALVAMCVLFGGCGSCGRGTDAPQQGTAAVGAPAAAPVKVPGKLQAAPAPPVTGHAPGAAAPPAEGGDSSAGGAAIPRKGPPEPAENDGDCIVVADADPDYGPPPLKVTFSAEAECNVGQPTFQWNFGDGSAPSSETNPTHTYAQAGDYTASVVIATPGGATASDEVDITVEEGEGEPQE
ncbi:MAG: PKD domain-containing protein [Candidatus Binatia bacterium]